MGDGKALQAGTSHNLGQNFAKGFDIQFQDVDGERKYAWTTSWGASTRLIGGVIMVHGDESGLQMPPRVAPIQVAIVPIWRKEPEREVVAEAVAGLEAQLRRAGVRIHTDWREETPGFKFNDWELRGVPLRLEVGPKDVQNHQAVLVRRDSRPRAKEMLPQDQVAERAQQLLVEIQQGLYQRALDFRKSRTYRADDFAALERLMADREHLGFVEAWWCGDGACEAEVKTKTQATIRNLPLAQPGGEGVCVNCGRPATRWAVFAKAY